MVKLFKNFFIFPIIVAIALVLYLSQNSYAASIQYKVKSGDTIYIIANKYGISTNEIIQTNNLSSTNLLVGQMLNLSVNPNYTVKSGDTLYLVSVKFNTTIEDLVAYNALTTTNINIGQNLRVVPLDPIINLSSGNYVGPQTVNLQNNLASMVTYYTLDGKTPSNTSSLFKTQLTLDKSATIKLVNMKNNNYSNVSSASFIINNPPASPESNLPSGEFLGGQEIQLSSVSGEIYYTLDGSIPTNNSLKYTGPINLISSAILKSVSFDSSTNLYSEVSGYNYIINSPAAPVSSYDSGKYTDILNLSLSNTDNVQMLYTLDNSDPISNGAIYTQTIEINKSSILKAVSVKNGAYSQVLTANFDIDLKPTAPISNIQSGTYDSIQSVALLSTQDDIYYTLDGSAPTVNSTKYTAPIVISEPTVIKAVSINKYNFTSDIAVFDYQVLIKPQAPIISTNSGTYFSPVSVDISSADNLTIYFTLDGSIPSQYSTKYSQAIVLSNSSVINAVAISKFNVVSDLVSSSYTIKLIPEAPKTNIGSGIYYEAKNIILSTEAQNADIFYTLNGSDVTASSIKYTTPVVIDKNTTIKAASFRNGYKSETVTLDLKIYIKPITNYTVLSTDTLASIAKKFYTTTTEIMSSNNLSSQTLTTGQVLKIYSYKYIVLSGENLSIISEKTNTTPENIISINSMASDIVFVGQAIKLPQWGTRTSTVSSIGFTTAKVASCNPNRLPPPSVTSRPEYNVTFATQQEEDLYWLSRIVFAESAGEVYNGQVAVGNVVVNRSKAYKMKIKDVVFDTEAGYIQFEPVINGSIFNNPNTSTKNAAQDAYTGIKPVGECLYFLNPKTAQSNWITNNRTFYMRIGNHDFYL